VNSVPGGGDAGRERSPWLVLLTVMLGSIAGALASTMIMVAVPSISAEFGVGQAAVQWSVTAYLLAMTLSMLLTPWLVTRFGLRRCYGAAVSMLMLGAVLSGISASFPMLLMMRVLEGLASGIIQPIPAIVILSTFPLSQQGRAMGIYGLGLVVLPGMGPWIGGLMVESLGWRSIFFPGVPICLIVLYLGRRHLPSQEPAATAQHAFDWTGMLLLGGGVIAMLNGVVQIRREPVQAWGLLTLGAACTVGFVIGQLRRGAAALLDMRLFGHRQFSMGALVSFTYGMGVFGSIYLLPVFLQLGLHYTSGQAGLVMMPAAAVLALTIVWAGHLTDRYPPHLLIAAGLLVLSASLALTAANAAVPSYTALIWLTILGRIGLGLVLPALSLGSMRGLDPTFVSQGATAILFLRQLGGALGVSLVGIVLEWRLGAHARQTAVPIEAGRIAAFNETLLMVAAVCAVSILAALAMRPSRLAER
jgi:MFS transporter, DHA2 family, multidrug resistance protein